MIKAKLLNNFPNPFDKTSNLAKLEQKGQVLEEVLLVPMFVRSLVMTVVLGLLFVLYFKVDPVLYIVIALVETLITFIRVLYKNEKIKAIKKINVENNDEAYPRLKKLQQKLDLQQKILNIALNIPVFLLIFLIFYEEIVQFVLKQVSPQLKTTIDLENVKLSVILIIIVQVVNLAVYIFKYKEIDSLNEDLKLAEFNLQFTLVENKFRVVEWTLNLLLIFIVVYLFGAPLWILLIFFVWGMFIISLQAIQNKRQKGMKLDNNLNESLTLKNVNILSDEKLVGSIFGINRTIRDLNDISKPAGYSFMGVGKNLQPENTLIITNYRLLFIQVPVTGGDNIINEVNYASQNFFYNRSEIIKNGQELLNNNSLAELTKYALRNILFTDVKTLTMKYSLLTIEMLDGDKVGYVFLDKEYIEPTKMIFSEYLKEKFLYTE